MNDLELLKVPTPSALYIVGWGITSFTTKGAENDGIRTFEVWVYNILNHLLTAVSQFVTFIATYFTGPCFWKRENHNLPSHSADFCLPTDLGENHSNLQIFMSKPTEYISSSWLKEITKPNLTEGEYSEISTREAIVHIILIQHILDWRLKAVPFSKLFLLFLGLNGFACRKCMAKKLSWLYQNLNLKTYVFRFPSLTLAFISHPIKEKDFYELATK